MVTAAGPAADAAGGPALLSVGPDTKDLYKRASASERQRPAPLEMAGTHSHSQEGELGRPGGCCDLADRPGMSWGQGAQIVIVPQSPSQAQGQQQQQQQQQVLVPVLTQVPTGWNAADQGNEASLMWVPLQSLALLQQQQQQQQQLQQQHQHQFQQLQHLQLLQQMQQPQQQLQGSAGQQQNDQQQRQQQPQQQRQQQQQLQQQQFNSLQQAQQLQQLQQLHSQQQLFQQQQQLFQQQQRSAQAAQLQANQASSQCQMLQQAQSMQQQELPRAQQLLLLQQQLRQLQQNGMVSPSSTPQQMDVLQWRAQRQGQEAWQHASQDTSQAPLPRQMQRWEPQRMQRGPGPPAPVGHGSVQAMTAGWGDDGGAGAGSVPYYAAELDEQFYVATPEDVLDYEDSRDYSEQTWPSSSPQGGKPFCQEVHDYHEQMWPPVPAPAAVSRKLCDEVVKPGHRAAHPLVQLSPSLTQAKKLPLESRRQPGAVLPSSHMGYPEKDRAREHGGAAFDTGSLRARRPGGPVAGHAAHHPWEPEGQLASRLPDKLQDKRRAVREGKPVSKPAANQPADSLVPPTDTMKSQLQALQHEDPTAIFIARRISKLGFASAELLRAHFSRYGEVKGVYVSHSRVKSLRSPGPGERRAADSTWRLRAAALGFVVMTFPEATARILAEGPEHVVNGVPVRVQTFHRRVCSADGEEEAELACCVPGSVSPEGAVRDGRQSAVLLAEHFLLGRPFMYCSEQELHSAMPEQYED